MAAEGFTLLDVVVCEALDGGDLAVQQSRCDLVTLHRVRQVQHWHPVLGGGFFRMHCSKTYAALAGCAWMCV